jgi:ribosome recycling factor
MGRAVQHFSDQLIGIRSGAIAPGVIDTVRVEQQGERVPIGRVAQTCSDHGRVTVRPHNPQMLGSIDRALKQAGFNSFIASRTEVAVCSSPLSGEQRAKVIAHVRRLAEEAKVAVRNLRRKARQRLAEDAEEKVQELTDEAIDRIERLRDGKIRAL